MLHRLKLVTSLSYLVNIPNRLVVHLLRTVKHINHDAQSSAKIFRGFGLACSSRPSRGTAHSQVQRLGEGDVTSSRKT